MRYAASGQTLNPVEVSTCDRPVKGDGTTVLRLHPQRGDDRTTTASSHAFTHLLFSSRSSHCRTRSATALGADELSFPSLSEDFDEPTVACPECFGPLLKALPDQQRP